MFIVTTDRGATKKYFGDMAWGCNPADINSIRSAIRKAYGSEKSEKMKNCAWERAAKLTIQAYEKII